MDHYICKLSDQVVRTSVRYQNRYGITLSGDLYHARNFDETEKHPAVLVGAPYGGVKEQGPSVWANELAQRGFGAGLTDEEWYAMITPLAEQRYEDFQETHQALGPRANILQVADAQDPLSREFAEFYNTERGYHPNSIGHFTATSTLAFANFPLLTNIKRISPRPLMMIAGENAASKMLTDEAFELAAEPKEKVIVPDCNHVDLYDDPAKIPFDTITAFFRKYLSCQ